MELRVAGCWGWMLWDQVTVANLGELLDWKKGQKLAANKKNLASASPLKKGLQQQLSWKNSSTPRPKKKCWRLWRGDQNTCGHRDWFVKLLWFSESASNNNVSEVSASCEYDAQWQQAPDWRLFQWVGRPFQRLMFQDASPSRPELFENTKLRGLKCVFKILSLVVVFVQLLWKISNWFHTIDTVLASYFSLTCWFFWGPKFLISNYFWGICFFWWVEIPRKSAVWRQ